MAWLRGLRHGERVILIVALGVAVEAFCSYFLPLNTLPFASTNQITFTQAGLLVGSELSSGLF